MSASPEENPKNASHQEAGPRHKKSSPANKKGSRGKVAAARILKWGGGLASAGLLAFITAYFTVLGNHAASAAQQSPAGEPIIATVGNITEDGASMVLPGPVALNKQQLNALSSSIDAPNSSYSNWFTNHKAAFVNSAGIQLTVQGNRHSTVQIVNITPLAECSNPLRGTLFYAPGQSDDVSAHLYFNLNDPQAPASYTRPNSAVIRPDYFANYTISLKYGEIFTFQLTASLVKKYCQFTFVISGITDGKKFTESVSDDGRPFRVTSLLLEPPSAGDTPIYSDYQDVYVSGPADGYKQDEDGTDLWVRIEPKHHQDPSS